MQYEVVIIGGSFAGLSAALPLLRARRQVLIIDAGQRRNRFTAHSHNFLTHDGRDPNLIIEEAKSQLERYPTLTWLNAYVDTVSHIEPVSVDGMQFQIKAGQQTIQAKKIIIATGVKDELPKISGLEQRWGNTVFHCPYCDGYELNMGRIGLLVTGLHGLHLALLLPDFGQTTLFMHGDMQVDQLDDALLTKLSARNVTIETRSITAIEEQCTAILDDGSRIQLDGLFVSTYMRLHANWIHQLGLEIDTNDYGEAIITSAMKQTNVDGIYACGDVTRSGGSVALSVGDGAMTGIVVHKSFIF